MPEPSPLPSAIASVEHRLQAIVQSDLERAARWCGPMTPPWPA